MLAPRSSFAGAVPKSDGELQACEDRIAFAERWFAVADGASGGAYSEVWAGFLVEVFCGLNLSSGFSEESEKLWLEESRRRWTAWLTEFLTQERPWFTVEKLRNGSFSTFLGLVFIPGGSDWIAIACGDSCLFHVRENRLLQSFPIDIGQPFDNSPRLLSTGPSPFANRLSRIAGSAQVGDRFYLVTDAFAEAILKSASSGGDPWTELEDIRSFEQLESLVETKRQTEGMRDDDTALLAIEVGRDS